MAKKELVKISKSQKFAVPKTVVKLLRKVEAIILEEPRRFDMEQIASIVNPDDYSDDVVYKETLPPCGTVGCIAGWVGILGMPNIKKDREGHFILPSQRELWNFAANALHLKFWEHASEDVQFLVEEGEIGRYKGPTLDAQIFYENCWPQPFKRRFQRESNKGTPNKQKLAVIAVERLENFIYTGK